VSAEIENKDSCTICLEELLANEKKTTPCRHDFHLQCILNWLNEKGDCPLCRTKLKANGERIRFDSAQNNAVVLNFPVASHPVYRQAFSEFPGIIFEKLKWPCIFFTGVIVLVAYIPFIMLILSFAWLNTFSCAKSITTTVELLSPVSFIFYLIGYVTMGYKSCQRHYPGLITTYGLVTELSISIAWILLIVAASLFQHC
jgi:hypothetical protein